jgi:hypothetical protein
MRTEQTEHLKQRWGVVNPTEKDNATSEAVSGVGSPHYLRILHLFQ